MRVDRPLVGAVISLDWGLGLIIGYSKGTTGFSAAYPFAGSLLHLELTTTGPGVMGGLVLITIGVLLLIWSFLVAMGSFFSGGGKHVEDAEWYSVVPPVDEPGTESDAERRHLSARSSERAQTF